VTSELSPPQSGTRWQDAETAIRAPLAVYSARANDARRTTQRLYPWQRATAPKALRPYGRRCARKHHCHCHERALMALCQWKACVCVVLSKNIQYPICTQVSLTQWHSIWDMGVDWRALLTWMYSTAYCRRNTYVCDTVKTLTKVCRSHVLYVSLTQCTLHGIVYEFIYCRECASTAYWQRKSCSCGTVQKANANACI
jgi:hypothetical protein